MKRYIVIILIALAKIMSSQVSITAGSYFQNFGTANISSWTNNSTFPGWYIGAGTHRGYADITLAVNSFNSGGYYTYNCGSDAKIGSRGSGTASLLYYGVVLQNNTGSTIQSVKVTYTGYQMSLAQNGAVNTINFEYITGATAPSITAATGTNVPALNFTQLQNSGVSGANQINWYPCTQSSASITACIPVTLTNGSYILLRWKDVDDTGNDHHMAIDNVDVAFDLTGGTCLTLLPIELLYFTTSLNKQHVDLNWETATEINNDYFTIERSSDGIAFEPLMIKKGAGNSLGNIKYSSVDDNPLSSISYYRLKQTNFNGTFTYSKIESVSLNKNEKIEVYPNPNENGLLKIATGSSNQYEIKLVDAIGQIIYEGQSNNPLTELDLTAFGKGVYILFITSESNNFTRKVIYK